mgnify:CR=1 FL=1
MHLRNALVDVEQEFLDAATFAWRASQDNAAWAKNLMEIITIIKAKGGKPADEL